MLGTSYFQPLRGYKGRVSVDEGGEGGKSIVLLSSTKELESHRVVSFVSLQVSVFKLGWVG